jgi:hypothetical protein
MFLQFQRSRRTDETQVSVIAASANCGQVTRFRRIIDSGWRRNLILRGGKNEISNSIGMADSSPLIVMSKASLK